MVLYLISLNKRKLIGIFIWVIILKIIQIHYESKHPKEDWEAIKNDYQAQIDANAEEAVKVREQKNKNK